MKNNHKKNRNPEPVFYEILIQGQLEPQRSKWFEGMTLTYIERPGCTRIAGPVIDQPALHGLLTKIRDLNLTLISVRGYVPGADTIEEIPFRGGPSADRND